MSTRLPNEIPIEFLKPWAQRHHPDFAEKLYVPPPAPRVLIDERIINNDPAYLATVLPQVREITQTAEREDIKRFLEEDMKWRSNEEVNAAITRFERMSRNMQRTLPPGSFGVAQGKFWFSDDLHGVVWLRELFKPSPRFKRNGRSLPPMVALLAFTKSLTPTLFEVMDITAERNLSWEEYVRLLVETGTAMDETHGMGVYMLARIGLSRATYIGETEYFPKRDEDHETDPKPPFQNLGGDQYVRVAIAKLPDGFFLGKQMRLAIETLFLLVLALPHGLVYNTERITLFQDNSSSELGDERVLVCYARHHKALQASADADEPSVPSPTTEGFEAYFDELFKTVRRRSGFSRDRFRKRYFIEIGSQSCSRIFHFCKTTFPLETRGYVFKRSTPLKSWLPDPDLRDAIERWDKLDREQADPGEPAQALRDPDAVVRALQTRRTEWQTKVIPHSGWGTHMGDQFGPALVQNPQVRVRTEAQNNRVFQIVAQEMEAIKEERASGGRSVQAERHRYNRTRTPSVVSPALQSLLFQPVVLPRLPDCTCPPLNVDRGGLEVDRQDLCGACLTRNLPRISSAQERKRRVVYCSRYVPKVEAFVRADQHISDPTHPLPLHDYQCRMFQSLHFMQFVTRRFDRLHRGRSTAKDVLSMDQTATVITQCCQSNRRAGKVSGEEYDLLQRVWRVFGSFRGLAFALAYVMRRNVMDVIDIVRVLAEAGVFPQRYAAPGADAMTDWPVMA